ncbi:hypothetical protein GGF38_001879, partial [Coemansia sp. RSA 25]
MVWPGVERLSVAIDDSSDEGFREVAMSRGLISAKVLRGLPIPGDLGTPDDLNELLMIALPSLSEIVWLDNYRYYVDTPISLSWLTSERLRGPEPLRALQVASGAIPEVLTAYSPPPDSAAAPAPIKIACLGIENRDRRSPLRLPPVFASTLVELTLDPVAKDEVWEHFVADNTQLEFPCLRVLALHFDDPQCGVMFPYSDKEMATSRSLTSTKFGTPLFPALTSLKICKFPGHLNQFLSLFAASPLSKLYIGGFNRLIPDELDLTPFTGLRSFGVCFIDPIIWLQNEYISDCLTSICQTASSKLQSLMLNMYIRDDFGFPAMEPVFADSLVSLTLLGEISSEDVGYLLLQLPKLKWLSLLCSVVPYIPSNEMLVELCQEESKRYLSRSVNMSLRCLRAARLQEEAYYANDMCPFSLSDTITQKLSLYRGLIFDL